MRRLARAIAAVGGVGYSPIAPGTVGSLAGLFLGLLWPALGSGISPLMLVAFAFLVGVVVSTRIEQGLKVHDPPWVVIDELVGMWAVLALVPRTSQAPWLVALAFGLFRLFDITKPPPLKLLGRFPGGWGVMLDDLGASAYTCLALGLILVIW